MLKRESTRSWSNKWTKHLYGDCLHRITNFISNNTKCRKQILNFDWNTWKYWWNETDDEILCVCTIYLKLKFTFSSSHEKLFLVLFQETYYIFSFKKMYYLSDFVFNMFWNLFLLLLLLLCVTIALVTHQTIKIETPVNYLSY